MGASRPPVIMTDNLAAIHDSEIDQLIEAFNGLGDWTQLCAQLWPCSCNQTQPPTAGCVHRTHFEIHASATLHLGGIM